MGVKAIMARRFLGRLVLLFALSFATTTPVLAASDKNLDLRGQISEDGSRIGLIWDIKGLPGAAQTTVYRRELGATGADSWRPVSDGLGGAPRFLDTSVSVGRGYEYQVIRDAGAVRHIGYWVAGTDIPARSSQGRVILVIDETIEADLDTEITRFERDLIGAGWQTTRLSSPRGPSRKQASKSLEMAREIKERLQDLYFSDPFLPHVIILIGRVPGVRSGNAAPDGHGRGPLHSDLFYADLDGNWPDNGDGLLLPSRIPTDHIETQIGRIDFSDLREAFGEEVALLRAYFDRNHAYRHGRVTGLKPAYASSKNLVVEQAALANIFGPTRVLEGNHHEAGQTGPWVFGVDFGAWNPEKYAPPSDIQAVFTINFGSGKHKLGMANNILTATLAQPGYTLAAGWGGRPAWRLHPMALGQTIGESHMRTVNNGSLFRKGRDSLEYTPTGLYEWLNPIWVNLLGDPTLSAFTVPPPTDLKAKASSNGIRLTWRSPVGAEPQGYRIYRSQTAAGPYELLTPSAPVTGLSFNDPGGQSGMHYMIRAEALQKVHAGSFYALSQGAFAAFAE